MTLSTNEATRGSFPERFGEILYVFTLMADDWKTGGTYWTAFKDLAQAYYNVTESGDIAIEGDLGRRVDGLFLSYQDAMFRLGQDLAQLARDTLVRHVNRDAGIGPAQGGSGYGGVGGGQVGTGFGAPSSQSYSLAALSGAVEAANREWSRQLRDPAGTAPAVTVQTVTTSVTGTAGTANVGTGTLLLSSRLGSGLNNPFLPAAKGKLTCVRAGNDDDGLYGHEEWLYEEAPGPPGGHPDWMQGNRGMVGGEGARLTLRTADPLGFADTKDGNRGNLLFPPKLFESNAPKRWTIVTGTAGTHVSGSSTTYVTGDSNHKSLKFHTSTTRAHVKQAFSSNAGSPAKLRGSACVGFCVRLRAESGTVSAGTLRAYFTKGDGTTLLKPDYDADGSDSEDADGQYDITLNGTTTTWTTYTNTFFLPDDVPEDAEFHLEIVSADLAGDHLLIDGLILAWEERPYPGGWYGVVFGGATHFVSKQRKIIPDYFDIAGANNSGGASTPYGTYQRGAAALLGHHALDSPWPESGTPDIADGTGIA